MIGLDVDFGGRVNFPLLNATLSAALSIPNFDPEDYRMKRTVCTLSMFLLLAGCYHATVETGATPSNEIIRKGWASGWIYGLVPPSTVETASKCRSGIARVETQLSFPNMLVSSLTFGIYTPMSIVVTCAAQRTASNFGQPDIDLGSASTSEARAKALADAVALSKKSGRPVVVDFGIVQN